MADKKKLDDLLTHDFARPPIRRGQGMTLSTQVPDEPVAVPSAAEATAEPAGAGEPIDAPTYQRTNAQTPKRIDRPGRDRSSRGNKRTNAQTHKRTNAQASAADEPVERVSQGQRLRVDLIRALKQIALDDDRKLYQVMEDAIEEYIDRRRRPS